MSIEQFENALTWARELCVRRKKSRSWKARHALLWMPSKPADVRYRLLSFLCETCKWKGAKIERVRKVFRARIKEIENDR